MLAAITGEQGKDVADRLAVDPSYVSMVRGNRRRPAPTFLASLATAYGLSGGQLEALAATDELDPVAIGQAVVAAIRAAGGPHPARRR